MSGSGGVIVTVDVEPVQPIQVVTVEIDGGAVDVAAPPAPTVEVALPPPQPPVSVDVVAPVPPTVVVDTPAPSPPPTVEVVLPDPVTVDVDVDPKPPMQVDVLAAWQGGIPDAPVDGTLYGRLNQHWVGVPGGEDLVTSVARKIGDVLIYTDDIEDWDGKVLDGGNF